MADAVAINVIANTGKEYVIHMTNISDGTGESAVHKVVKSALNVFGKKATPPALLAIDRVRWAIQGMSTVRLAFDHTIPDQALLLSANGFEDFRGAPGDLRDFESTPGLVDPSSAGGTGDITLTTNGQVSGGTYDITLWVRLVP